MAGSEPKVFQTWLSQIASSKNWDLAIAELKRLLAQANSKKDPYVLLSEGMEAIDYGKMKVKPEDLVALNKLWPKSSKKDRDFTDDIVQKLIPEKYWSQLRDSKWIKDHGISATADISAFDKPSPMRVEFKHVLKVGSIADMMEEYLKEFPEYKDSSINDLIQAVIDELVMPDVKKWVEKVDKEVYNKLSNDEMEYFVSLEDSSHDSNAKDLSLTLSLALQIQVENEVFTKTEAVVNSVKFKL